MAFSRKRKCHCEAGAFPAEAISCRQKKIVTALPRDEPLGAVMPVTGGGPEEMEKSQDLSQSR